MELHNAAEAIAWLENSGKGFWKEKWRTGEVWSPAQSNAQEKKTVQFSMVEKLRQCAVVKGLVIL